MAKYRITPSSRTIVQSPISIGHKAEKGVEAIEFDLTAWVETYGSGTLTVIMRRWGDAIPYPIALEIDENNKATWTLSDTDTAKAGMAYAQLSYIVGDEVVKKSDIYTFRVMDSLTGEGEPPEAYESWLEHLTHFAAEAMAEVLDIEGVATDKTLTVDGGIADAKATGDALALKADKSTTYTKVEVDQMIADVEVETDTTLSVTGKPADAKKTGDEITALRADLAPLTSAKSALLECLKHVKFDEDGHTYYDALEDALFPSASLESITAVYNPGQNTIYDITPLSELKRYITVTGNYEGGESKTLTAYTLSGTLAPGTNTITISAGSVTTTISVTAVKYWTYAWSYADGLPGNNGLVKETTGTVTETLESDGVRVAVENTSDKRARYYYSGLSSTQLYTEGIFELEFKVNAYGSYSVAPYGNGVRLSASLGNRNGNSVNTAQLAFNTSGVLYVKTGTTNWTLLDNSAFELDTWYKVRIEQSLTKADVYVDGVFVGSILTADNKESVLRPIFTAYRGVDVTFKAFRMRVA